MGIFTRWMDSQQNIILIEFDTEWTWDDVHVAVEKADTMIGSVTHRVDLIIDMVDSTTVPKDFLNFAKELLNSEHDPRPNEGARVIVGASKAIRTAYNTLVKTFGNRIEGRGVHFAKDVQDARAIVMGLREETS